MALQDLTGCHSTACAQLLNKSVIPLLRDHVYQASCIRCNCSVLASKCSKWNWMDRIIFQCGWSDLIEKFSIQAMESLIFSCVQFRPVWCCAHTHIPSLTAGKWMHECRCCHWITLVATTLCYTVQKTCLHVTSALTILLHRGHTFSTFGVLVCLSPP